MIQITNLEFHYKTGDFSLRIPELSIDDGSQVAVIGPSGSGKTTLLHLLAGILTPERGRVIVDAVPINTLTDAGRRDFRITNIGFIFQDFELLDYLNVLDNILHPYRITGALKLDREVRARAAMLAKAMGIGDKLKRRPNHLSQGEKQRVAICRALLPQPKLILADEATGNLDPDLSREVMNLFRMINAHGTTVLIATHDRELLRRMGRRIITLERGRIVAGAVN